MSPRTDVGGWNSSVVAAVEFAAWLFAGDVQPLDVSVSLGVHSPKYLLERALFTPQSDARKWCRSV